MNRVRFDFHEEWVRLPTVSWSNKNKNKNKNKRKRQWVLLFYCYRKRQMWSKAHEGLRSIAYFSKWLINVQFVVNIFVLGTKKKKVIRIFENKFYLYGDIISLFLTTASISSFQLLYIRKQVLTFSNCPS
jgi:hypothetical protein